jgi:hypothetical protein
MKIRNLTLSIVIVQLMTVSFAQKIRTKMEWAIRDKMINVNDAKKEGFLMSFSGSENQMSTDKIKIGKIGKSEITDFGRYNESLFYFFNFETKKLTIYSRTKKLFDYEIKRVIRKKNDILIKIKTKREKFDISVDLVENKFYEVKYDRYRKISLIQFHNSIELYPKY